MRGHGLRAFGSETPCWRFADLNTVVLSSKPVLVRISKGESLFFAENENLNIYATGETRDEAIQTFFRPGDSIFITITSG